MHHRHDVVAANAAPDATGHERFQQVTPASPVFRRLPSCCARCLNASAGSTGAIRSPSGAATGADGSSALAMASSSGNSSMHTPSSGSSNVTATRYSGAPSTWPVVVALRQRERLAASTPPRRHSGAPANPRCSGRHGLFSGARTPARLLRRVRRAGYKPPPGCCETPGG